MAFIFLTDPLFPLFVVLERIIIIFFSFGDTPCSDHLGWSFCHTSLSTPSHFLDRHVI